MRKFLYQLDDLIDHAEAAIPYRWHVIGAVLLSILAASVIMWLIEHIEIIRALQRAIWGD